MSVVWRPHGPPCAVATVAQTSPWRKNCVCTLTRHQERTGYTYIPSLSVYGPRPHIKYIGFGVICICITGGGIHFCSSGFGETLAWISSSCDVTSRTFWCSALLRSRSRRDCLVRLTISPLIACVDATEPETVNLEHQATLGRRPLCLQSHVMAPVQACSCMLSYCLPVAWRCTGAAAAACCGSRPARPAVGSA